MVEAAFEAKAWNALFFIQNSDCLDGFGGASTAGCRRSVPCRANQPGANVSADRTFDPYF
jgi:hypothetical protein